MEKSTISALVVAGGGVLAAVVQVFVLRAAKRKRTKEREPELENRMRQFDSDHGIDSPESDE